MIQSEKPRAVPPAKQKRLDRLKAESADGAAKLLALVLRPWGKNTYRDLVNALWERQPLDSEREIVLRVNEHQSPDPSERPLVERIFAAYQLAKRDQLQQDPMFLPGGGWKNVTDSAFSYLLDGYEQNDLDRFHYFLANFGAWEKPTGIGESWVFSKLNASSSKRKFFEQQTMPQLIQWWEVFESQGRSLSELVIPSHGNQGGALVDGHLILPNSVFSECYARMLAGFVDRPRPVIGELGGGFGRLCCFLKRQFQESTYVGFDLPECLACASYYLMLSFPEKSFLLYGEGDLNAEALSSFDFILLPSFETKNIPDRSLDLFVNENSLGMVPPKTCEFFVKEMCRTANAIWHRNHEIRRNPTGDGSLSLLNYEYPFDRDHFQEVVRFSDVSRLVGHERSKIKADMYWYYFRRKDGWE